MIPLKLSIIIPAKDVNDAKLAELLRSINNQDFPKEELEVLIITEGTSESAKAIGIRRAKGDVIGILASDNELVDSDALKKLYTKVINVDCATYPMHYFYCEQDDVLNRYFSLIGGNDPLSFYMGKNDRLPKYQTECMKLWRDARGLTVGDNGFFVKRSHIASTDLDNYYHIDNANEIPCVISAHYLADIWHKTGGNIFKFFAKRYRYGLQHAFNSNRRWHLVDFSKPQDIRRLIWFVLATVTVIQPLSLSIRGWLKIRDKAWFLHPIVCFLTLGTYTALMIHLGCRNLYQLLFAPMVAQRA